MWEGFSDFMDYMLKLGIVYPKVKTHTPSQCQKFCGLLFDTTGYPTIRIPANKCSQGLAMIDYLFSLNDKQTLSRLSAAVAGGFLQSLVEGTSQHQGQTYLRSLYDDIHQTTFKLCYMAKKCTLHPFLCPNAPMKTSSGDKLGSNVILETAALVVVTWVL